MTSDPKRPSYLWIIVTALGWPLILVGISALRFGLLPQDASGALDLVQVGSGIAGFILLGAGSGWFALWLARRGGRRESIGLWLGYALAVPIAYIGGLIGPLSFEVFANAPSWVVYAFIYPLGVLIGGGIPLAISTILGYSIGRAAAAPTASHQ
jgi:MFS family permease